MADPVTLAVATAAVGVSSAAVGTAGELSGLAKDKADLQARQRMAKINADETEVTALADLKRQISNIKAIRASTGSAIDTPTMNSILAEERRVSDVNLAKKKNSFKLEELQAKADKSLIKRQQYFAMAGGALKGAQSIVSAIPAKEA